MMGIPVPEKTFFILNKNPVGTLNDIQKLNYE